jgi:hypothetical protein
LWSGDVAGDDVSRTEKRKLDDLGDLPEATIEAIADFLSKSARPSAGGAALAEELSDSLSLKAILSAPVRS